MRQTLADQTRIASVHPAMRREASAVMATNRANTKRPPSRQIVRPNTRSSAYDGVRPLIAVKLVLGIVLHREVADRTEEKRIGKVTKRAKERVVEAAR